MSEKKNGIKDNINHNFAKIRTDSYNSLPSKKYRLSIMLYYSFSHLSIRKRINTTIIYF